MTESQAGAALLLTSAGAKIPMLQAARQAWLRLFPTGGIIAGDMQPLCVSRAFADSFWQMPATVNANKAELRRGCIERNIKVILPSRDGELLFWAESKPYFAEAGIQIIVSPATGTALCLDKLAFADFGQQHQLPIIPASLHIDNVIAEQFVVKERFGAGAKSIGLALSKAQAIQHAKQLQNPLYQPMQSGKEVSIDAWLDQDSSVKGLVLRQRDKVVAGESQISTTFTDAALTQQCSKILRQLKLTGPVVMQAIIDAKGKPHIIECNSRFGGASTLSILAGLDSLYWSFLQAMQPEATLTAYTAATQSIRQLRYSMDTYQYDPDF
ncbi:carbamoyl-phosphate synthase large subunit [Arsukibacterium tuosuense]|uniref:Carbamoyl-phosphate synthase large subunit n=1 Tax=Arsukibacterium tuosuense TaxID=1323745 RepID=A0A285J6U1_9GAMM|nr:ATP-grasp domain-containing protein [Arsukibacterium tuosuense]SNY56035.1 carbamoyl-phosphate synthase large subunit [Arsukibacterium tuosuense]